VGRRTVVAAVLILAGLALGAGYLLTPHDHVAPGCFWWTAQRVGDVLPGQSGCVRGYIVPGGAIAEGKDPGDLRLSYSGPLLPQGQTCPFRPGDAVVLSFDAIFDDGRTIIEVRGCPYGPAGRSPTPPSLHSPSNVGVRAVQKDAFALECAFEVL